LEQWRATTPDHFQFAVKASRFLTHMKKLKEPQEGLEKLFSRMTALKEKLGPILFQLPPNFALNSERLESFLEALPPSHLYVFEFRHQSWSTPEVFRLLRKHNAAYCAFHIDGFQSPLTVTADFAYVRLHGPGGKYQGSYSEEVLQQWAGRINAWQTELSAVYVYFDNDDSGFAAKNAIRLGELI
jgi:uncharacterized protein YecE (DUF72 family)